MSTTLEDILTETATKIFKSRCTKELINEAEQGVFPIQLWNEVEEMGMTTMGIPEEAGGTGFIYKDALNILRIAGKYAAPIPLAETLVSNWLLHETGIIIGKSPKTIVLPSVNEIVEFTEDQDYWNISGQVKYVPFAECSSQIVVLGRTVNKEQIMGIVDRSQVLINGGQGLAGDSKDIVVFKNIRISKDSAKRIPNEIIKKVYNQLALTRIVLMSGALERVLELTVQHAKEREQFGRPIGKFQAVKQQLAVLAAQVSSGRTASDYVVDSINKGVDFEWEVAIGKVRLGEAVGIAVPIAHQVHAAIGFTYEHPLHHSTRRLWTWRDEYGNENKWAEELGSFILNDTNKPVWNLLI
jgi:acyl-CoA dehydrogenase